jgi:DNA repair protein RecN (Recombination protein N)
VTLTHLRVHNLAVLAELDLDFGPGLTVITGETGSGKSMIMRALRLACALDGDAKWIGPVDDHTIVEVELDAPEADSPLYDAEACAWGVSCRLTEKSRRYSGWGTAVSASIVRESMGPLVRFVRQGETSLLRSAAAQRAWLDGWAGLDLSEVESAWRSLAQARADYESQLERQRRADYERFEHEDHVRRLSKLSLDDDSYEQVREHEQLVTRYANVGEHVKALMGALDPDEGPWAQIADLSRSAEKLPEAAAQAWDLFIEAQSALVSELDDLGANLPDLDVDAVLDRAGAYRQLLVRYGPTIEDARLKLEASQDALAELDDMPAIVEAAKDRVEACQRAYDDAASRLTEQRKTSAKRLAKTHLPEIFEALALHGDVSCEIEPAQPSASGVDQVSLRVRMGKTWLDMGDISGGELSRVAVALERLQPTHRTLVLDEIDVGVGGQTAHLVAAQLAELAKSTQVIVVTHLAQIAKLADAHIVVSREGEVGRAQLLNKSRRAAEIRRMKGD